MDFGVARWPEAENPDAERDDRLIGSLRYIAPEQIRGADVDGRADIYSLGITAFELLTGHAPFRNDSPLGLIMAHLNQPAPDPRAYADDIPDPVADAVLTALANDPNDRFPTASAFIAACQA
jgi:serine/threonine-protein kinase